MTERSAEEQVADGAQAELRELAADRRADPGENVDRPRQAVDAWGQPESFPVVASLERGERSHGSDASRSVGSQPA